MISFPDSDIAADVCHTKSDFRAVKVLACEAVPKSKKLLKFTLNDGTDKPRTILSGIHEYYEPEELLGKTCIAIVNLPPRNMMGIDSEGMLLSAIHTEEGQEKKPPARTKRAQRKTEPAGNRFSAWMENSTGSVC